jgi:putative serine protease PepD
VTDGDNTTGYAGVTGPGSGSAPFAGSVTPGGQMPSQGSTPSVGQGPAGPGPWQQPTQPAQPAQQPAPGQYGQPGQPGQYGQHNQHGQPEQYGQAGQYGQVGPPTGQYGQVGPPGQPTQPVPQQGFGQPASPWWANGAANDPWRDPNAPAAVYQPGGPGRPPLEPRAPLMRRGLGTTLAITVLVALIVGTLGGAIGYAATARTSIGRNVLGPSYTDTPKSANRAPTSVAGVVKAVLPSVVTVLIQTSDTKGNGSGFIISDKGYILTNNHVAAAAAGGSLMVTFSDGTTVPATVKGTDPQADLAVLKVDKSGLNPIKFGDSDRIAVGDPVLAIGAPLDLPNTVTAGIVSALDRPVLTGKDEGSEAYMAAIQTDAAINPGNSGGPLLDGSGHVVGVNSAILTLSDSNSADAKSGNIGLGFSIPINEAKRIANDIIQTGKARRTVIGASLDPSYDSPSGGVRLSAVTANGPADKGGLKSGDVIMKFDGNLVTASTDLLAFIGKDAPGARVPVSYQRDGSTHTTTITLAAA